MKRVLPDWELFEKAALFVWSHRSYALKISTPYFFVICLYAILGATLGTLDKTNKSFDLLTAAHTFLIVLSLLIICVMAIQWHRHILLNETAPSYKNVRKNGILGRYIFHSFLILLICLPIGVLIGLQLLSLMPSASKYPGLIQLFSFILPIPLYYIAFRLSIALPAIAIGRTDYGIRKAWDVSSASQKPILYIVILTNLLEFILDSSIVILGSLLAMAIPGLEKSHFVAIASYVTAIPVTLMTVGQLTLAFAILDYENNPEEAKNGGETA